MTTISQLMSLAGRRAMVTGAAGRLGRVFAETLAELGADLVLVDRPGVEYGSFVTSLQRRWPVHVLVVDCDLEQQADRDRLVAAESDRAPALDVLINGAALVGTSDLHGWATTFDEQSVETWRRALEVNLTAVFDLTKGLAPMLRRSSSASVINIASIYGSLGPDHRLYAGTSMGSPAAYAASKGGLIQLTRWLATTLAPRVRVNAISPGGVRRSQSIEFIERYEARTPLGRMATEDDVRGAVAYLASDLSAYVTGQNMTVDGGWSRW